MQFSMNLLYKHAECRQLPEDNPFSNIVKETKEYIGYHVDILQWDGHCVILVFEDNVYGWQIVCWLWSLLSPAVITLDSLTPDTPVGPDNGIIWNNVRIVLIEPLGKILTFSLKIMYLKMPPANWRLIHPSLNVLTGGLNLYMLMVSGQNRLLYFYCGVPRGPILGSILNNICMLPWGGNMNKWGMFLYVWQFSRLI